MFIDDPLSISNSDNPNAQLTQLLFDGSNFVTWSRQLRRALGAKMKIGFLTGAVAKPSSDSKDLPRWTRCDEMVVCWMLNSMVPELSNSFILTDSAKDLWLEIVDRYSQVLTRLLELEDQDKLLHFLVNLNSDYDHVKSQIIAMEPIPTLNRAYYLVLQLTHVVLDPTAFQAGSMQTGGGHFDSGGSKKFGNIDPAFVQAMCTEMMKVLKGKGLAGTSYLNHVYFESNKHEWILDTGATDHMSPHLDCMIDVRLLDDPILVKLPDDSSRQVDRVGNVVLSSELMITDVLFVPTFQFNLLSVSKIIKHHSLVAYFGASGCHLQDLLSRNLVAEGRARGGLYTLLATQKDVASCFTASNKPEDISRASVEPVNDGIASVVGEDSLGSSEVVDHGIVPIRQSTRTRHAPAWTADYVLQVTDNVRHFQDYFASLSHVLAVHEPCHYSAAQGIPEWEEAMSKEVQALEENGTWELTTLPPGARAIGSK
ncbi:hypothetical protein V2J09_012556 [Rumex salicifolius]